MLVTLLAMSRLLAVLSIFVGLALLLVLGWRWLAPANLDAPQQPAADSSTAAGSAPGANARAATDTVAIASRSEVTAQAARQRRVRIVDETGAPVANAEVAFDVARVDDPIALQAAGRDVEAEMSQAPRFRSAPDGMVVLPTDAEIAFLIARAGERFGCDVVDFGDRLVDVHDVRIAPDRTLAIVVVDPRGKPCPGIPVVVFYEDEAAHLEGRTPWLVLPRTDEAGRVAFWHAQTLDLWNPTDPTVELRADVTGDYSETVRIRLAERAPEVIRLVCPEHGGIRVRAWFAAGVPSQVDFDPSLSEIVQGKELGCSALTAAGSTRAEVLLHPVASHRQWKITAHGFGERRCDGPADRSEVVIDLFANGTHRVITGLLVQPDRLPCASMSITVFVNGILQHEDHTDATGRFHLATSPDWTEITLRAEELHASARVALPSSRDTASIADLGVVRLASASLLAAGRVVDATTKQPLRTKLWALPSSSPNSPAPDSPTTYSAIDGSFELWGPAEDDIVVIARTSGYATSTRPVKCGSRDVVLAMQSERQLRATVLVDPGITVDGAGVRVRSGDKRVRWNRSQSRPGQLTCLFTLPASEGLVLEVAGAEDMPALRQVPKSEWTRDDDLWCATVDLRNALAMTQVTVRRSDTDGETSGSLFVRPLGGSTSWGSLSLAPRLVFAAPKGTVMDAIVRPDSGMCVRATLQPGENTIDVPPPSRVRIEVAGMPPEAAADALALHVCRLVRREPLLDELVAAGLDVDRAEVRPWPRSAADLEAMETEDFRRLPGEDSFKFSLRRRGSYVAVPFVVANANQIAFLDAAVALEITTPGAVVEARIRFDPEKVRAALR